MKKEFLKLSVLFVALFIGIIGAKANILVPDARTCSISNPAPGVAIGTCDMYFKITEDSVIKNGDVFEVTVYDPLNIVDGNVTIASADANLWEITNGGLINITTKKTITVKYIGTTDLTVADDEVKFAYGTYDKTDPYGDQCGFAYGFLAKACTTRNGYFYDKNGDLTDEATYYKDCFACSTPEQSPDGKYHGLDGKETDEATYNKECTNICKIENDKYYCKDGNECTKEDYENECAKNPNQGAFLPIVGVIAGIALIGVSTIMVKKQSKLRRL